MRAATGRRVVLNAAGQAWPHGAQPHATVSSLTHLCRLLG